MYLRESRTLGSKGNMARKLTVKLWGNGVFEKKESVQGSINTQYFRRSAGQFIYSKLDFQNQAFGIVPEDLDSYESTVDLPCFDISVELNPIFLLEYVKRKDFYKRVGEAADGSRKAKRIQVETFLNCPITIPSKEEQNRIASCLSSLDDLITAQAKKIDLLKTYKKGLMQQLFPREGETQPRLRFPEFRGNGEWEEKCLASEVNLISGVHLSPEQYSTTGEVPYFTGPSDFTNDTESVVKWAKRSASMAASNDTLITVKGSGVGEVWYSTLQAVALGRQLMAVRVKQGASQFIYQFLLTRKTRFEDLGSGNLIPGLSRTDILDMEVRFPRPDEQQRIASCLSSLDALITTETQKFEALKTHKKGLMQGLFPA
jgi:type I restriction enzyme S subunit